VTEFALPEFAYIFLSVRIDENQLERGVGVTFSALSVVMNRITILK